MTQLMQMVPRRAFLTKGIGRHKEKLTSFEEALREARIAQYNLVNVSSIFPPNCEIVSADEGLELLDPGQIVFAVVAREATCEPSRLVAASIGLAIPKDSSRYGYISEHHGFGQRTDEAGDYAEDLAASMLATTLGVAFNPDEAWDERREQWLMSGEIVQTEHISCTAEAAEDRRWVTVVSALVFCS